MHLNAIAFERAGNHIGSAAFFEGQFRMRVNVAANGRYFGQKRQV